MQEQSLGIGLLMESNQFKFMKEFFTLKKIVIFLSIISLGIIGLVIADQIDFKNGRSMSQQNPIGNGTSDPLIINTTKEKQLSNQAILSPSKIQTTSSTSASIPNIDGIRSQKNN